MIQNILSDTIEYIKDLTGLTNVSTAKVVRALNYAVDHYTYLALTSSGRWKWDSTNQTDVSRLTTTVTSADDKVELESDTVTIQQVEILVDGKYKIVHPTDIRDNQMEPISEQFDTQGIPQYYDFSGRNLYLFPSSDSSRTLRVTVGRAHPRFSPTDLTVSVGVSPIHEEYIALYAADRLMIGSNDPSRTQIRNEMTIKQEEIRDLFSKRDQDSVRRIKSNIPSVFMHRSRGKRY